MIKISIKRGLLLKNTCTFKIFFILSDLGKKLNNIIKVSVSYKKTTVILVKKMQRFNLGLAF